jgi:hypothetical protein
VKKRLFGIVAALSLLMVPSFNGATAGPSQGGVSSDTVEYVGYVPFEVGTATGVTVKGKYMYLTSWKNISIYDISDPTSPQIVGTPFPLGFKFENEDVEITPDAKYLLFSEELPRNFLHVYDIEDKENIQEVASVAGVGDHTSTCILKCKYVYGSDGSITNLKDPTKPEVIAAAGQPGNWHELIGLQGRAHDVTEYKNGFVVISPHSAPLMVADVRNPLRPRVFGLGEHPNPSGFLFHSGNWPRGGKDRWLLMQGEKNFQTRCNENNGPFMTWDAKNVKKTKTFKLVDTFRVQNGTVTDGNPPANGLGCSAHWFTERPGFKNGGLVAAGYYEHGTRFLNVNKKGKISEQGWFLPFGGSTSAAYWINKEIVYAVDYTRGIDILRWNG